MMDTQRTEVAPQVLEQVQQYVAEYCPDLADAEYSVQTRHPHAPSDEMLSKVQATPPTEPSPMNEVRERRPAYVVAPPAPQANGRTAVAPPTAAPHYTITLRKNVRTDNGALLPRIARFVVDGSGQILRATASKLAASASRQCSSTANLKPPAGVGGEILNCVNLAPQFGLCWLKRLVVWQHFSPKPPLGAFYIVSLNHICPNPGVLAAWVCNPQSTICNLQSTICNLIGGVDYD